MFFQIIWDEVGEFDTEKDKMLVELEQECLKIYRSKVDEANHCRAQLRRAISDSEAEVAAICSAMGELQVHTRQVGLCSSYQITIYVVYQLFFSMIFVAVIQKHPSCVNTIIFLAHSESRKLKGGTEVHNAAA